MFVWKRYFTLAKGKISCITSIMQILEGSFIHLVCTQNLQ